MAEPGARTADPMPAVAIVTPAARGSRSGNRVTALRYALLLRQLGTRPFVTERWSGRPAAALIAVQAHKTAPSVLAFLAAHPDRRVAVMLAGTEVFPEFRPDATTHQVLERAHVLLALQPETARVLPGGLRDKLRVIVQSARAPRGAAAPPPPTAAQPLRACVLAHLRAVKDPMLVFAAERLVPEAVPLRVTLAGRALDAGLAAAATAAATPRCRWIGALSRRAAQRLLAESHVCILPSRGEGGANVTSEAIAAGTPLLATAIPGNTGVLGADWPGLFPAGSAADLARQLERVATDPAHYRELRRRTAALQPLVDPARERRELAALLQALAVPAGD